MAIIPPPAQRFGINSSLVQVFRQGNGNNVVHLRCDGSLCPGSVVRAAVRVPCEVTIFGPGDVPSPADESGDSGAPWNLFYRTRVYPLLTSRGLLPRQPRRFVVLEFAGNAPASFFHSLKRDRDKFAPGACVVLSTDVSDWNATLAVRRVGKNVPSVTVKTLRPPNGGARDVDMDDFTASRCFLAGKRPRSCARWNSAAVRKLVHDNHTKFQWFEHCSSAHAAGLNADDDVFALMSVCSGPASIPDNRIVVHAAHRPPAIRFDDAPYPNSKMSSSS